jgi:hypothetical protein
MNYQAPSILDVVFYGPLKVFVCADSGAVVAVQDKATGARAEGLYRLAYLAHAKTEARAAWACRQDH